MLPFHSSGVRCKMGLTERYNCIPTQSQELRGKYSGRLISISFCMRSMYVLSRLQERSFTPRTQAAARVAQHAAAALPHVAPAPPPATHQPPSGKVTQGPTPHSAETPPRAALATSARRPIPDTCIRTDAAHQYFPISLIILSVLFSQLKTSKTRKTNKLCKCARCSTLLLILPDTLEH